MNKKLIANPQIEISITIIKRNINFLTKKHKLKQLNY